MLIILVSFITTVILLKGAESSLSNVTRGGAKLPEIRDGEKCTFGKKYRMDCNVCYCGHDNNLLCTKAACFHPPPRPPREDYVLTVEDPGIHSRSNIREENTVGKKKKVKKDGRQRREEKAPLKSVKPSYPKLPTGPCTPGRIYQEGCQRCYCTAGKSPICSTENACTNEPIMRQNLRALDIRTPIKDEEFNSLEVLPHAAWPCEPGNTYKVDCNACVCDEFKNLLCDKLLCINYHDMHRAQAADKSGLPCNKDKFVENEIIQTKCVKCSCNGTTHCKAVDDCEAEEELVLRTSSKRNGAALAYDYTVEKCLASHIYSDNCNRCYCGEDQILRCTQKTCLNYKQSKMLDEKQKFLKEHGL